MECDKFERVHSNLKINKFLLFLRRGIHTCDRNVYIILLVLSLFPPLRSKIVLATHFLPTAFLFFFPLSLTGGSSDFFFLRAHLFKRKTKNNCILFEDNPTNPLCLFSLFPIHCPTTYKK